MLYVSELAFSQCKFSASLLIDEFGAIPVKPHFLSAAQVSDQVHFGANPV